MRGDHIFHVRKLIREQQRALRALHRVRRVRGDLGGPGQRRREQLGFGDDLVNAVRELDAPPALRAVYASGVLTTRNDSQHQMP